MYKSKLVKKFISSNSDVFPSELREKSWNCKIKVAITIFYPVAEVSLHSKLNWAE